jgi:hypothetical protein
MHSALWSVSTGSVLRGVLIENLVLCHLVSSNVFYLHAH